MENALQRCMPFGEESQAIYTLTSCNYCLKINPQGCSFPIISTLPVSEKAFRHGNRMAAGHHPVHPKMQSLSIQVGYQQHLLHPSYLSLFPLSLCNIILNNHFLKLPYSKTFSDSHCLRKSLIFKPFFFFPSSYFLSFSISLVWSKYIGHIH